MSNRWHILTRLVRVAAAALLLSAPISAYAQEKINVGVSTLSTDWLPIFVADKQGYFKEEGLDATVTAFQSGTQAFAALSGGDLDIVGGAANRGVIALDKGMDVVAVAAISDGYFFKLMVAGNGSGGIESVADLRGKRIAAKPGALSETLLKFVLARNDIALNEVEIVGVPNEAAELALVQQGQVDAVMTGEPTATIYRHREMATTLIDFGNIDQLKELGWDWLVPTHVLTMMAQSHFLDQRPEVAKAALRALRRALMAIHDDPEIAIDSWFQLNPGETNQDVVRDSVMALVPGWSHEGELLETGMDNLQELMIGAGLIEKAHPFSEVATNDYLPD